MATPRVAFGYRGKIHKGSPAMSANDNMVAASLIVEPWSEEEVEKAHALRDTQYERDEIVLDEEEEAED